MYELVNNTSQKNLLDVLTHSIEECRRFYFNVAFISFSGVQLLLDSLKVAEDNGTKGKIITGTYLNFTDPKAVRRLMQFDDFNVRIFQATETQGFHPKAYIFEYDEYYKIIIGSSNLTNYALKSNIEWNLQIITKNSENSNDFLPYLKESFNNIWDQCTPNTKDLLDKYEKHYAEYHKGDMVEEARPRQIFKFPLEARLKPNSMQIYAVDELNSLRKNGAKRALAVAATGTGKTYMAAFDVKKFNPKKMLFVVHREMILEKALESFAKVVRIPSSQMGFFTGNKRSHQADYLFATNLSMSNNLHLFSPEEFDYIIIDEAHHATSSSYQKIIDHFNPAFLLGMTATPERSDDGNVFDLFDNNLAIDIRLKQALGDGLLVPFHYYGITDQNEIDLSDEKLSPDQIADLLNVTSRVDFIIDRMKFYGYDGDKLRSLGFCITKKHAEFMANEFNKRGIKAAYLTGESSESERQDVIKDLESEVHNLKIIFTVDIFNEGIDIPSVNQVLMLRPTRSPIIFTQQLGRGLRKHESKEFLTVLDFIGNYSKSFLIALALYGSRSVSKKEITHAVKHDFRSIPGPSNIRMDKISKNQILNQLERENFYAFKYLQDDYNSFKSALAGRIPLRLQDYLTMEGAPDPVLFFSKSISANRSNNYYQFLTKMEKANKKIQNISNNEQFNNIYSTYSSLLPIKRPHDWAILELALTQQTLTFQEALVNISKYVEGDQRDTTQHALETFELQYADIVEKNGFKTLEQFDDGSYKFNHELTEFIKDKTYGPILSDMIHYGLIRYQIEYGRYNYGYPFLKLYAEYSQREVGIMANYRTTHSAFRGSTLQERRGGNQYFLFIDLHKEDNIEESINYKDKFINQKQFQWESPNKTSLTSPTGQNLTTNLSKNITIHLFVRKYKTVNNVTQRYTYIGTADALSHRNEKPIEIQYALHHKMPIDLYQEFEPEKADF